MDLFAPAWHAAAAAVETRLLTTLSVEQAYEAYKVPGGTLRLLRDIDQLDAALATVIAHAEDMRARLQNVCGMLANGLAESRAGNRTDEGTP